MASRVLFQFHSIDQDPSVQVEARFKGVPRSSGVFRVFDTHGNLLLLDKTHNLGRRLGHFFSPEQGTQAIDLTRITSRIEYCRTDSPLETLYLLYSERRRWFPRTFHKMRTFPNSYLLKINPRQRFPGLYAAQDVKSTVHYFGPFWRRSEMDRLKQTLERTFRIRPCRYNIRGDFPYPDCLYFQMETCSRPCNADIDRASYMRDVEHAIAFIEGREEDVIVDLLKSIRQLAEETRFEEAENLHRQVLRIRRSREQHRRSYFNLECFDFVAVMPSNSVKKRKIAIVKAGCILGFEEHALDGIEASLTASLQGDSTTCLTSLARRDRQYDEFCLVSRFLTRQVKTVRLFPLKKAKPTAIEIAKELRI